MNQPLILRPMPSASGNRLCGFALRCRRALKSLRGTCQVHAENPYLK